MACECNLRCSTASTGGARSKRAESGSGHCWPPTQDREIAFVELRNEIDPTKPDQIKWCRNLLPYVETLVRGVPVTVSVTGGVSRLVDLRRQLGQIKPDFWDFHYYGVAGGAYATFAAARAVVQPDELYIGEFGFSTWIGNASVPGLPSSQEELDAYQAYYYSSVEAATKALGLPPAAPWTLNDFSRTGTPPQPSPAQYFYGLYRLNGSAKYYSRGFTLSGRPGGLSSNPAVVPGYVQ
jgi:hypothetical protein